MDAPKPLYALVLVAIICNETDNARETNLTTECKITLSAPHDARTLGEDANVLILCLDEHYATTLAHWLRAAGALVEVVQSGRQANRLLHTGAKWVLITDRVVPPWPGLPRLASLKGRHKLLRIVAIGCGDADSAYVALAAGADAAVSQPLRRDVVMRAIGVAEASD